MITLGPCINSGHWPPLYCTRRQFKFIERFSELWKKHFQMYQNQRLFLFHKNYSCHLGAVYLHLLEFFFIYQFYSWMTTLVERTFWNPVELFVFKSVHNNLKLFWYGVLLKMRGIFFAHISFEIQQTDNWTDNIQSFEISFQLPF